MTLQLLPPVKIGNFLGGYLSSLLVLAAFLTAFLPSGASAQIWVDEEEIGAYETNYSHYGSADTVRIYYDFTPSISNVVTFPFYNNGHIETMDISGGVYESANVFHVPAYNYGSIGTVDVDAFIARDNPADNASLYSYGSIEVANINDVGVMVIEGGIVKTANVNADYMFAGDFGALFVKGTGRIETANINSGFMELLDGSVGILNATGGDVYNGGFIPGDPDLGTPAIPAGNPVIEKAYVGGSSNITNYSHIEEVFIKGNENENDYFDNCYFNNGGTIQNLRLDAGLVANGDWVGDGSIEEASVNGGTLDNGYGGVVQNLQLNGGTLNNADSGVVQNLLQNGGGVENNPGRYANAGGGRIENMTYVSGEFNGEKGSIGTLTVAGNLVAGANWGQIDNLVFAADGSGILSIKAFANETEEPAMRTFAAFTVAAAEATTNTTFAGINAKEIDFSNGTLRLDLSELGVEVAAVVSDYIASEGSLPLPTILGGTISGVAKVVRIGVGEGVSMEDIATLEDLVRNDFVHSGVSDVNTTYSTYEVMPVPEPATLLMFGLGLAGLGLARRRRK